MPIPISMQVIQMLFGRQVSQAISAAAELGIADALRDAPKHIDELAAATSTHAPSLYRLLRALASVGVFAETEDRRFGLTPLAACLRGDAPDSIRNLARWSSVPLILRGWEELLHSVKTGETGVKQALGITDPFAYLSEHPEQEQLFHACMSEVSRKNTPVIVEARSKNLGSDGSLPGRITDSIRSTRPSGAMAWRTFRRMATAGASSQS